MLLEDYLDVIDMGEVMHRAYPRKKWVDQYRTRADLDSLASIM